MNTDHYLKAADHEALLAALAAAGLCEIVEAHTVDVPEHYAQNLVPAGPEIAAALTEQFMQMAMAEFKETGAFPSPYVMLEHEGKTYYGTGDAWMVDEPVLVAAHQVDVPRHAILPDHVRLDVITEGIPGVDGCHANLLLIDADLTDEQKAVLPLIDKPNNPVRVWA